MTMNITWLAKVTAALAIGTLLVAACATEVVDPEVEPTDAIQQSSTSSECGGFAQAMDDSGNAPAYCDAEVLHWSYDSGTQKLSLSNTRIGFNCCGTRGAVLTRSGDGYLMTETDAPVEQDMRCGCDCVFDIALTAEGIPAGLFDLELVREVTDSGQGPETVFTGTLDLSLGSGFEILDQTPHYNCGMD
jgi:hypothetical protein